MRTGRNIVKRGRKIYLLKLLPYAQIIIIMETKHNTTVCFDLKFEKNLCTCRDPIISGSGFFFVFPFSPALDGAVVVGSP